MDVVCVRNKRNCVDYIGICHMLSFCGDRYFGEINFCVALSG